MKILEKYETEIIVVGKMKHKDKSQTTKKGHVYQNIWFGTMFMYNLLQYTNYNVCIHLKFR